MQAFVGSSFEADERVLASAEGEPYCRFLWRDLLRTVEKGMKSRKYLDTPIDEGGNKIRLLF